MLMRVLVRGRSLGLCIAMLAALAARAAAAEPSAFAGTWIRDERERDDAAREAEIERVTESMSFAFRGFARGVMRRRMRPEEGFAIAHDAVTVLIRADSGAEYWLDGQSYSGGADQEVTSRLASDGTIEQTWRHGESHGTTVWRLPDAGDRLVVSDTVRDPHFSEPIAFSTTYRRLAAESPSD